MTEQQKYSLLKKINELEIRRYSPYVCADVLVEGDFESAGNRGFRPLANYIFSNKIAMTAPVIIEEASAQQWQVSFVMPDQSRFEEMPVPSGQVRLRASEGEVCAALRFSGLATSAKVRAKTKKLLSLLEANGYLSAGEVRVARFDPPWKPGFLRHNEVIVPINWGDQGDV